MKAAKVLFCKELRENAQWAVVGAVVLSIVLAYGVYEAVEVGYGPSLPVINAMAIWISANAAFGVVAPVIGLVLACLQILPERGRDRWAFLIHRPAVRFELFAGKAAAGVSLLLAAAGMPLIGLILWMLAPGHVVGRFDWGATEFAIVSIATGVVFYFAGLLACVRPARWYGSRVMPIPAALFCAATVLVLPHEFGCGLVTVGVCAAIIGTAAYESFRTVAGDRTFSRLGRFCLGATLAMGIGLTGTMIAMMVGSAVPGTPKMVWLQRMGQQTTEDGRIVQQMLLDNQVYAVVDINGRPLHVYSPEQWVASHPLFDMMEVDTPQKPGYHSFTYINSQQLGRIWHVEAPSLATSTANGFLIYNLNRRLLFTIPRAYDPSVYNDVSAGVTGTGRLIFSYRHAVEGPDYARFTIPSHVVIYDNTGRRMSEYSVAPGGPSILDNMALATPADRWNNLFLGMVVPATVVIAAATVPQALVGSPPLWESVARFAGQPSFGYLLIGSGIVGLMSALVTWPITRRYGFGRKGALAWVVSNISLSWIGVFVLVALRPFPAREPCGACGKTRMLTGDTCEHCGAAWPNIERDGTEIIDEPSAPVSVAV